MNTRTGLYPILMAALITACSGASGKEQPAAESAVPVKLMAVQDLSYAEPVIATGTLTTSDEVQLGFKVGGVVTSVLVREGVAVRKGQVLARLDLREIDAQLSKARTALAKAERDLARVRNLHRDSVATLENLQDATSALEIARSDYNAVAFNQRFATIVAPSDGVILRRDADAGELVTPGQTILVLGSGSSGSIVRLGVVDRDAVRLHIGDAASVTFSAYPKQVFAGVVTEIPAAANALTGTYAVEVRLATPPPMASGLVGSVTIQPTTSGSVRFVPIDAVVEADGEQGFVFTVQGDTARRVAVAIGSIDENRVAITGGLDGVRTVVSAGAAYLTDGAKVKVVK